MLNHLILYLQFVASPPTPLPQPGFERQANLFIGQEQETYSTSDKREIYLHTKKNEKPIKRRFFKQKFKCLRVETQKKIYKGVGELPRTLVRHTPSSKSHFLLPRY